MVDIVRENNKIIHLFQIIDDGKIKEFDPAHILLQNSESILSKMCDTLDEQEREVVKCLAIDKHEKDPYVEPLRAPSIELGLPSGMKNLRSPTVPLCKGQLNDYCIL